MRSFRRLAWSVAVAALLGSLAACGGGGGGSSSSGGTVVDPPAAPTPTLQVSPKEVSTAVVWGTYEQPSVNFEVRIADPVVGETYYVYVYKDGTSIDRAAYMPNGYSGTLLVVFKTAAEVGAGTFVSNVRLEGCYDQACTKPMAGSPVSVKVTLIVPPAPGTVPAPEPGVAQFVPTSRSTLNHDVIDAEFSPTLNAIVMVSSHPTAGLHIYDLATSSERSIALASAPTSLGIGPDGVHAVIGHAGAVSYLDLRTVGTSGAAPPMQLPISAPAGDMVLGGNGYAYVFPSTAAPIARVHAVDVATGLESVGADDVPAGMRARIAPDGASLVAASQEELHTFTIAGGVASRVAVHSDAGGYPCGDLVYNRSGDLLFTGCGMVLQPIAAQPGNFAYVTRLQFVDRAKYSLIRAISTAEDPTSGQFSFVTEPLEGCDNAAKPDGCWTHLETFAAGDYSNGAVLSLAPITIAGVDYMQRGLFVFRPAGSASVLISRASGSPNADSEVYLSRF